jgi:Predicted transcriptional regulator
MLIGERLRKFRTLRGYSQKELGKMTGLSEPAIRNYELGNRTPSEAQLQKISNALEVSYFALANPDIHSYMSIIHALFKLEDEINLRPADIDGEIILKIDAEKINDYLREWMKVHQQFLDGKIIEEDYEEWKIAFPQYIAINNKKKLPSKREKEL